MAATAPPRRRLYLFRVTCPTEKARYYRTKGGAVRQANRLLDEEHFPEATSDYGYSEGVAIWRRNMDRPWEWSAVGGWAT